MPAPDDRDLLRLHSILKLAKLIRGQLDPLTEADFLASQDHVDLAAYRLGFVGEYANKLSPELKAKHPEITWRQIYDMRNAPFHDYEGKAGRLIWTAAGKPLEDLVSVCDVELAVKGANLAPAASP